MRLVGQNHFDKQSARTDKCPFAACSPHPHVLSTCWLSKDDGVMGYISQLRKCSSYAHAVCLSVPMCVNVRMGRTPRRRCRTVHSATAAPAAQLDHVTLGPLERRGLSKPTFYSVPHSSNHSPGVGNLVGHGAQRGSPLPLLLYLLVGPAGATRPSADALRITCVLFTTQDCCSLTDTRVGASTRTNSASHAIAPHPNHAAPRDPVRVCTGCGGTLPRKHSPA